MRVSSRLLLAANATGLLLWSYAFSKSTPNDVVVRMAQLEIDPARLEDYKRAVREEMQDAVRLEPGVLAIYAVAEKENPARLHFFEIYTSEAAYASHRETPHFRKYLALTRPMIRDRKLIEAIPVQMSDKAGR
ncbi:MAG TPA: putative quinol monooxygenase [Steroidobacteraceae bacterium]|nr:putative quinol monooxygenase [Steroidobacteraceae bacterium]